MHFLSRIFQAKKTTTSSKKSLAYRKNEARIKKGEIPSKYQRILPHVKGERILEIGAAEGVLSLLLSETKEKIVALERQKERHEEALRLKEIWRRRGMKVEGCQMIHGDITQRFDLLHDIDTVVAVRCIYYFKENTDRIFEEISKHAQAVVLCGNANRAQRFESGSRHDSKLGKYEFYATSKGMREILERHGYVVTDAVETGDAIIVGEKRKT